MKLVEEQLDSEEQRMNRIESATMKTLSENPIGLHGILENIYSIRVHKQTHIFSRNRNGFD